MSNEWLDKCPELPGEDRDNYLVEAITNGLVNFDWVDVISNIDGHTATFQVLADAAYITLDDGGRFRPMVSASLNQKIADMLNVSMLTAKIHDLSYAQATQIECSVLSAGPQMSSTSYSKKWNAIVETKRNGCTALIRDTGKIWCLDNSLAWSSG